nr:ACP S-malonyltransferase [uncultured Methylophaga sp.]
MTKAIVFPGQGIQKKGMGGKLFSLYPEYVDRCHDILGYDIKELCLHDPENKLSLTQFTQPAVFVVSYLDYIHQYGHKVNAAGLAGHSVGEYAALCVANALDFETALRTVAKRGQLMAEATNGKMAAVLGCDEVAVKEFINLSKIEKLYVANCNSPTQVVIGGAEAAVDGFIDYMQTEDYRVIPLRVSGAFHTPLMSKAAEAFSSHLEAISLSEPECPVICNVTASPHNLNELKARLSEHLTHKVLWTKSIEFLLDRGVNEFIELSSTILTPMIEQIKQVWSTSSSQAVSSFTKEVKGFPLYSSDIKPIMVCTDNKALIKAITSEKCLCFYDTSDKTISQITHELREIKESLQLFENFGVLVHKNAHFTNDDCVELMKILSQFSITNLALVDFLDIPDWACDYKLDLGLEQATGLPKGKIIFHPRSLKVLPEIISTPINYSQSDDDTSRFFSAIDGIYIDVKEDLNKTKKLIKELLSEQPDEFTPYGDIFIGVSGSELGKNELTTQLNKGYDFVLCSTVFDLCAESCTEENIKSHLSQLETVDFHEEVDWHYPTLTDRNRYIILNHEANNKIKRIHELYINNLLSPQSLADTDSNSGQAFFDKQFYSQCQTMNTYEFRATVAKKLSKIQKQFLIQTDTVFINAQSWFESKDSNHVISARELLSTIL